MQRKTYTHPALNKYEYLSEDCISTSATTPDLGDMGSGDDDGGDAW